PCPIRRHAVRGETPDAAGGDGGVEADVREVRDGADGEVGGDEGGGGGHGDGALSAECTGPRIKSGVTGLGWTCAGIQQPAARRSADDCALPHHANRGMYPTMLARETETRSATRLAGGSLKASSSAAWMEPVMNRRSMPNWAAPMASVRTESPMARIWLLSN